MSADHPPKRVAGVQTRASRILSATLLVLIVASVVFAPQILRLAPVSRGTQVEDKEGDDDDVADEKVEGGEGDEGGFWPGMMLMDRNGKPSIHIFSDGRRASGVPGLVGCLKHEDAGVRESSAKWLEAIGPAAKDALPALRETLNDPDDGVRAAAKAAIKSIKKKRPADRR